MYLTNVLKSTLLVSDTRAVRLFFAILSILFGIDMYLDVAAPEFVAIYSMTPRISNPNVVWSLSFMMYGMLLIKGLAGRHGLFYLVFEAIFGWTLWTMLAVSSTLIHHHVDIVSGGTIIATWLLVRYPIHRKVLNG